MSKDPKDIARELKNWLGSACFDYALAYYENYDIYTERKADELYNDVEFLEDVLGDKISDATYPNKEKFNAVCEELKKHGHAALKKACKELMKS